VSEEKKKSGEGSRRTRHSSSREKRRGWPLTVYSSFSGNHQPQV
jgi:hypothetical protein